MNLAYFKSYLAVVKQSSFSEAAKLLGLSQPTVSFQIQRLEEELETKLLERHGGRVIVTAAGREFQTFVEKVLHEQLVLKEKLASLQEEVAGTLRLGASTHPGEYILPRILGAFRQEYPRAYATIVIADTADIVERVLSRECDAALVGAEVKRRGLDAKKIAEDPLMLVAPPGHRLTERSSVKLEDIEAEAFVIRERGSGTQRTIEENMQAAGVNPIGLREALVVGSNQAVITAVEAGVGIAFVSRMSAARSLDLGLVKAIPIEGLDWHRGIYYIQPSRPQETRLLREFAAFVERWKG